MCGVVGFIPGSGDSVPISLQPYSAFERLFKESTVRGLHAFGMAWTGLPGGPPLVYNKTHNLRELLRHCPISRPVIGHARYSLSGDWHDHANNQPLMRENRALVFNGVIDMGTKEQMEDRWGLPLPSYNDGEIFLELLEENGGSTEWAEDWVQRINGSFAGLWLEPNRMCALRNARRPLWISYQYGCTYFASTRDIFLRAGFADARCIRAGVVLEFRF